MMSEFFGIGVPFSFSYGFQLFESLSSSFFPHNVGLGVDKG